MDKTYHYSDGKRKKTAVGLDGLRRAGIRPDTLIWYEGLGDWRRAKELPELRGLFAKSPPPLPSRRATGNAWVWLLILLFATILILLLNQRHQSADDEPVIDSQTFIEEPVQPTDNAVEEAPKKSDSGTAKGKEYELLHPEKFLKITILKIEKPMFSKKTNLDIEVSNTATEVVYSDVYLRVSFRDKYGNELDFDAAQIGQRFEPGSTAQSLVKVVAPTGTKTFEVSVESAKSE